MPASAHPSITNPPIPSRPVGQDRGQRLGDLPSTGAASWAQVCLPVLPEQPRHLRRDQHHQLSGRPLVPQGLAQNQRPLAVDIIGGQRDECLVRHCGHRGQSQQLLSGHIAWDGAGDGRAPSSLKLHDSHTVAAQCSPVFAGKSSCMNFHVNTPTPTLGEYEGTVDVRLSQPEYSENFRALAK